MLHKYIWNTHTRSALIQVCVCESFGNSTSCSDISHSCFAAASSRALLQGVSSWQFLKLKGKKCYGSEFLLQVTNFVVDFSKYWHLDKYRTQDYGACERALGSLTAIHSNIIGASTTLLAMGLRWVSRVLYSERDYDPETPCNFSHHSRVISAGWHAHLRYDWWGLPSGEAALALPCWKAPRNSSLDWTIVGVTLGPDSEVSVWVLGTQCWG